MKVQKKAAQLFVDCLIKQGVEIIFGIPGAKIDALFDALLDVPIKLVLCRHEQNAAFMAAAYGRLTGKPGVVVVTSGPGVANLATGLLTATTEGDPVIAIGGNVSRNMRLKESHQGMDNIKLMEAVTKARMEVMVAGNIPDIIENAFRKAVQPRSGAVFISLPQDMLTELTTAEATDPAPEVKRGLAPQEEIEKAAKLINAAKEPVLFLGLEASRPDNASAIRSLLKDCYLPTISTYQAAGVVSRELESCFLGRVGLFKNQPGDQLLDAADVVITVGYNPVEYDPEIWNSVKNKIIIHIDYQPTDIHINYSPSLEVIGDIAGNIHNLKGFLKKPSQVPVHTLITTLQEGLKTKIASGAKFSGNLIHPLRFINDLRSALDDDAIVISDIGTHYLWLARYFFSYQPHHLLFSNGQQTLGVALPWAMAACFVYPHKKIISISGDGGFLFSVMELETAVREKLHFIHFVWNDGTYNMVLEQQLKKYQRDSAVHFGKVDVVKLAESFGAHGLRINHSDDFLSVLNTAHSLEGPVIVEVNIDYSDNAQLFESVHESAMN
jgi:acetolactate synthase-1/2/3 large subunit